MAACDNNDNTDVTPVAARITATIGECTPSRAVDQSWSKGDQIGISSTVGTEAGPYINVQYTTNEGNGIFTGAPLFFYKPMTLTAYYPFAESLGADGIIEANTRPENQDQKQQPNIDFLWDSQTGFTATEPNVNFVFTHKMSKITFTFQSSEAVVIDGITIAGPVDVSDMINYTIKDLGVEGTFNTATGVCAIDESKHDGLEITFAKETPGMKERSLPSIIVFPQSLKDGSVQLNITTDELNRPDALQHYNCNLSFSNGELKPGYHYKYTIKVTKIGLIVGKMTVTPGWRKAGS